jgi:hypothetical protein
MVEAIKQDINYLATFIAKQKCKKSKHQKLDSALSRIANFVTMVEKTTPKKEEQKT